MNCFLFLSCVLKRFESITAANLQPFCVPFESQNYQVGEKITKQTQGLSKLLKIQRMWEEVELNSEGFG